MGNNQSYSWHEEKRHSNLGKHGLDFAEVHKLDWDNAIYQSQVVDFEERTLCYVPFGINLRVVVFTERVDNIHIISYRKATRREIIRYVENQ